MSGHTKGPWYYREIAPYEDGLGYISADGRDIIHAGVSELPADENRANARLIAAAPELLEALQEVRRVGDDKLAFASEWAAAVAKADAAILAATGASS